MNDPHADEVIQISAKKGIHTDELLKLIEEVLQQGQIYLEKVYAYAEARKISMIRKYGTILTEEYREEGIYIEAYVTAEVIHSV